MSKYKSIVQDRYRPGEACQWWKGYVWDDFNRLETIVAPVGFNVLFYCAYSLFLFVRRFPVPFVQFKNRRVK